MSLPHPLFHEMAMTEMGKMILPNVRVEDKGDSMEFYLAQHRLGKVTLASSPKGLVWYAYFARSSLLVSELVLVEDARSGPFKSPSEAIRRLLQADNRPSVKFEDGVCGNDQESSFMNATLQGAGEEFEFSVATNLDVPRHVLAEGKEAVAGYVKASLKRASIATPGLAFDVQFGPAGSDEE